MRRVITTLLFSNVLHERLMCGHQIEAGPEVWPNTYNEIFRRCHKCLEGSPVEVTRDEAKELIHAEVSAVQGCKATELAVQVGKLPAFQEFRLVELLEEMIREGRLVEVEYSLPSMPYRTKSFFFPKGTVVSLVK